MDSHTGKLFYQDQKFSYEENGQSRILLDCQDYFANKSRIPMHSFVEEDITIPVFLLGLLERYGELSGGTGEEENGEEIQLIGVLTAAFLIRFALPVKAVELGCTSGVLSYYLAKILGTFNPESSLCCVTDVIGNSSENGWLDRISLADNPPSLSMLASDYDDTQLESGHFDLVVINGTRGVGNPDGVIREAKRLAKKGGLILAYCCDSPLLESCFCLHFPERKEYHLEVNTRIMTAECGQGLPEEDQGVLWRRKVEKYAGQLKEVLMQRQESLLQRAEVLMQEQESLMQEPESLMQKLESFMQGSEVFKQKQELFSHRLESGWDMEEIAKQLDQYIREAMDLGELEWKIRLIDMKELVLDIWINGKTDVQEELKRIWPV